jgi:hypothetical protein
MMPPNGRKSIERQMTRLIEGRIDNILWELEQRRRSDSNELPWFTTKADMGESTGEAQDVDEEQLYFE